MRPELYQFYLENMEEFQVEPIRVPTSYYVDLELLLSQIGYSIDDLNKPASYDPQNCYRKMTQRAIEFTIDSICRQILGKNSIIKVSLKKSNQKLGYVKWVYETDVCFICIYLIDGSLIYKIGIKTRVINQVKDNLYYDYDSMERKLGNLIFEIVKDFSPLIRAVHDLKDSYYDYGYDNIPVNDYKERSKFCTRREDFLLHERHFYDFHDATYSHAVFYWDDLIEKYNLNTL